MTGRVERDHRVAERQALAERVAFDRGLRPEPVAQEADARGRGMIVARAAARMVGMGVRDERAIDRTPGIDVEVAPRAVQPLRRQRDQVGPPGHHAASGSAKRST